MRILMFGWEFPPYISGGLGTACFGMTKALKDCGIEITFVLPRIKGEIKESHVKLVSASEILPPTGPFTASNPENIEIRTIDSVLRPYLNESLYLQLLERRRKQNQKNEGHPSLIELSGDYGPDLISEIKRYGSAAERVAKEMKFDAIHTHDWITTFAGIRAKEVSGKPLIHHVHALEFDRSGENINEEIYNIERSGMESANHIIAVSQYTKQMIVQRYGVPASKITIVHNGVALNEKTTIWGVRKGRRGKIILYLGRITFQKGPDYFIEAAARVLKVFPETTFVMAGSGDMLPRMIERVAELGIGKNFHFTGFLRGKAIEEIYAMSDLYVMPSVSEPFGISPLEAIIHDVPVIISRQSGVSEVLSHALKVDFWDVYQLANKMIAILKYSALSSEMKERGREEVGMISWRNSARKILSVYRNVIQSYHH